MNSGLLSKHDREFFCLFLRFCKVWEILSLVAPAALVRISTTHPACWHASIALQPPCIVITHLLSVTGHHSSFMQTSCLQGKDTHVSTHACCFPIPCLSAGSCVISHLVHINLLRIFACSLCHSLRTGSQRMSHRQVPQQRLQICVSKAGITKSQRQQCLYF